MLCNQIRILEFSPNLELSLRAIPFKRVRGRVTGKKIYNEGGGLRAKSM